MKKEIYNITSAGVQWMVTTIAILFSTSGVYMELRQGERFVISGEIFIILGLIGGLVGVVWAINHGDENVEAKVTNRIEYITLILLWPIIYGGLLVLLALLGLQNTLIIRYSPVNEILLFSGGIIFSFVIVYVLEVELVNPLSRN